MNQLQKTAISRAIEELDIINKQIKEEVPEWDEATKICVCGTLELFKNKILKSLIPYEEKTIKNTFDKGKDQYHAEQVIGFPFESSDEYFNKTFKQKII